MHTVFLLIYLLIALWGGLAGFQLLTKEESNKYWYLAFLHTLLVMFVRVYHKQANDDEMGSAGEGV